MHNLSDLSSSSCTKLLPSLIYTTRCCIVTDNLNNLNEKPVKVYFKILINIEVFIYKHIIYNE